MMTLDLLNGIFLSNAQLLVDFCSKTERIWAFLGQIIKFIQIAIPILIVLLGTIDLGKAVLSGEEKKVKEAQSTLIRRLIYGVAIFFMVVIVQLVFGLLGDNDTTNAACFNAIKSGQIQ